MSDDIDDWYAAREEVQSMSDDLSMILESPTVERVATDFVFTEGPLWHPDGFLLFVDIRRSLLLRWQPGKGVEIVRENTGEGNGLTFDRQGRLIMCEGGNRRLSRTEADGRVVTLVDRWQGKRLNRPNDVVCHSDGRIYFTDPGLRVPPEQREIDVSPVFRVAPDGTIALATADCEYPNGLAFSPDERTLYVANTRHQMYMRAFDVQPDGTLTNSRVFADMSSTEEGVPDGMKVDAEGRIFCTGPGGAWVFDPSGRHLGTIRLPEIPANCAFGGPDRRTLFFTARTSLYAVRVKVPGITAL
jgi:sugar lactone lactonase YvrE